MIEWFCTGIRRIRAEWRKNMLYTKEQKEKLEKVIEVFQDYVRESSYAEIVWSDKIGYVYLCIDQVRRQVVTTLELDCAETLCDRLFYEVAQDVLDLTGNDHTSKDADPLEKAEITRRLETYLKQLPEYRYIAEKLFAKE